MPLGVLMSINRLFSSNVFGGQQLWVWKNPGTRTASSESVGSASPASSSSGAVAGSKSPAPNAAAALAVAAVAAGKANMRRTPSPPLERKATGDVRSPHEEAIAAFKNSMELDAGATLEEHVWWRLVGSKTPVVEGTLVVTDETLTFTPTAAGGGAPVALPLKSVKECLLLPHLRESWDTQSFAEALKAGRLTGKAPSEPRNYLYFRLRVRDAKAESEGAPYLYYDCAMASSKYPVFYGRFMRSGGFDMAISEIFMDVDDVGDESPAEARRPALAHAGPSGLGGLVPASIMSLWSRGRSDTVTAAAPERATNDAGDPAGDSSAGSAAATPSLPAGRPKSKSFSGDSGVHAPASTAGGGGAGGGFLSMFTPLLPSRGGNKHAAAAAKDTAAAASAGKGPSAPVAVPVPSGHHHHHHLHGIAHSFHHRGRRKHGGKPATPPPAPPSSLVEAPPTSVPTLFKDDDAARRLRRLSTTSGTDTDSGAGDDDGNDHDDQGGSGRDDGADDDAKSGSAQSWDDLEDVHEILADAEATPARPHPQLRRSNSDASSIHSAFSVSNLVGKFEPKLLHASEIMRQAFVDRLVKALPKRLRLSNWFLIYSTYVHGITLTTLYHKVQQLEEPGESILVIRDNAGHIFGCFAVDPWKQEPFYYGSGEMFLFRLWPDWKLYTWSNKNSFFQLGQHNCLAVGGGGTFALWLDQQLYHGSSSACETFDNEPLGSQEDFLVMGLELWGFAPSMGRAF